MAHHESLHAYMLPVMERFGAPCVTQCTYLSVRLALGPNLPLRAGPLRELRLRNMVPHLLSIPRYLLMGLVTTATSRTRGAAPLTSPTGSPTGRRQAAAITTWDVG
jgi:hypothetical protein